MGIRRQGRELALTYLYQLDLGIEKLESLETKMDADALASKKVLDFAKSRTRGVWQNLSAIDQAISSNLQHWKLERLTRTDRGLLRLGVFELLYDKDIPARVVIDEAVEIGKKFGGDASAKFINGVLDAVLHSKRGK